MAGQVVADHAGPDGPRYLEREVFCCGADPFMKAGREMLASLGFDMARYHEESFAAPALEEVPIESATPAEVSEITFAGSGWSIACDGTVRVLAVARRAGLTIPSGCKFGLCGTCKVRNLSGEVTMVQNGGITTDEIAEGFILACCSSPQGALTIDL